MVKQYQDKQLVLCDEHYTSKTCEKCGNINKDLKDEKIYNCSKCGMYKDRDINAARNIFIKNYLSQLELC